VSNPDHKKITDYFRENIFEAFSAYNAWKMLAYSKSNAIFPNKIAERYVEVQKYHSHFFYAAERSFLVTFVLYTLHSFDKRKDSLSLYKINPQDTGVFISDNSKVVTDLRKIRHEIFAHRNKKSLLGVEQYKIPSIHELDMFFGNLITFYNKLTLTVDNSSTIFSNAQNIKADIEDLFMSLYRGEMAKQSDIDINWSEQNASIIL
jgi:hypothetical protein